MTEALNALILRELLRYDAQNGRIYWEPRDRKWFSDGKHSAQVYCEIWNKRFAHKEAFRATSPDGYRRGEILGRKFLAHRVVFAWHNGAWPTSQVDHIDGDRTNNKVENLREASSSENSQNLGCRKNNTTGLPGVSKGQRGRWRASITSNYIGAFLGEFDTPEEAHQAYLQAKAEIHPFQTLSRLGV